MLRGVHKSFQNGCILYCDVLCNTDMSNVALNWKCHDIYCLVPVSCDYRRTFRFVVSNQKQYFQRKTQNFHYHYISAKSSISLVSGLSAKHLVVWTGKLSRQLAHCLAGSEDCLLLVATVRCVRWRWLSLVWGFVTLSLTSFAILRLGNILRPSESPIKFEREFLCCYQRHAWTRYVSLLSVTAFNSAYHRSVLYL
jgi:hypothetical protein